MGKIENYELDTDIQDDDKVIGTDAQDENKTKNYSVGGLSEHIIGNLGSGTPGTLVKWETSSTIGDSIITQPTSTSASIGVDSTYSLTLNATTEIAGAVKDSTGTLGTDEKILRSNASGELLWVDSHLNADGVMLLDPYDFPSSPGGSSNYSEPNNIIYTHWTGGAGTFTLTLPDASAIPYRILRIITNSGFSASNRIEVTPIVGQTIDGGASYIINKSYNGIAVWSDGSDWIVIQAKAT